MSIPSRVARVLAACCALLLAFGAALAQNAPGRVAGDVVSLEGNRLALRTAAGEMLTVALPDNARITLRSPGDLGRIAAGQFVGATAAPQPDGTLLASQINIFPESLRGTGEGHRPMSNLPGSTMTNATVREVARNTVTEARVTGVSGTADARRLVLTYAGGEKVVIVPPGAAVVLSEVGDRATLVRGAHVIVYGNRQADGSLAAERVSVGKNGSVPLG